MLTYKGEHSLYSYYKSRNWIHSIEVTCDYFPKFAIIDIEIQLTDVGLG